MDPGSHVEFQISTKNTNLVADHPMNIFGKFGSNLFSGFREEDLNVTRGSQEPVIAHLVFNLTSKVDRK